MSRLTKRDKYGHWYTNERIHDRMGSDEPYPHAYDGKPIDKLAEYETAEEQGLLLRLPCKVEDTVYVIVKKDISPQKVVEIHRSCNGIEIMTNRRVFHISAIGKTVFLTREEAESTLAEKGGA